MHLLVATPIKVLQLHAWQQNALIFVTCGRNLDDVDSLVAKLEDQALTSTVIKKKNLRHARKWFDKCNNYDCVGITLITIINNDVHILSME